MDGVFTTDPRVVAQAPKMDRVSHDEMLEMASLGAGVMHSRSIEFGKKFSVPIHVRNSGSFSDEPGTVIGPLPESADRAVSGAALTKDEARITVAGVPDRPGLMHQLFAAIAEESIAVDMVVQDVGHDGKADIAFTVLEGELAPDLESGRKVRCRVSRSQSHPRGGPFQGFGRRPRHGNPNGRGRPHVPGVCR